MEQVFIIAIFTVIVFLLIKYAESKYLEKESKPLKLIVRDALVVFVASMTSAFVFFYFQVTIRDFFNVVTDTTTLNTATTQIFTDTPGF
jgi:hypothetical protein